MSLICLNKRNRPASCGGWLIVLCLIFCTGCQRTLRLRAVDARNNQFLTGYSVVWLETKPGLLKSVSHSTNSVPKGDAKGEVVISGVSSASSHDFVFSKDGYANARLGCSKSGWYIISPDTLKAGDARSVNRQPYRAPIIVPLQALSDR